ncbi:hypothetical protein MTR67_011981 [Solanum verrucosum]|uniref:Uncharacterized protein n=1 Tax=Solanum verrucosum TaxID=315347 RepID=A0AAF0QDN6_SOLVR|nr:hypothetical protein MTR67_011981 [Solanum verrucosum]
MAKIMTQMDLLTKHVMGGGYKAVNVVGASSGVNPDDTIWPMYNEEVQLLSNQVGGSRLISLRSGGNQSCNRDRDDGGRIEIANGVTLVQIGETDMVTKIAMGLLMNVKC